jgi:hypothetical protein
MTSPEKRSKMVPVMLAVTVVAILAGSLGARLVARGHGDSANIPPAAFVPEPPVLQVADLEVPCWSCPSANEWPIRFQTDLDLLAPLGTGVANAAEWFALFAKDGGPRADEAAAATQRAIDGPEWLGKVLPPDDPLLIEAEPWCDQATMSFYPDVFALDGYSTRVTNLLFAITLVRSWIARGEAAEDDEAAMADFRRAIRLGRLLRQEDVVVISDLVGLACIHLGTRGVYERALADGDLELALLASVVLGEVAAQRLGTQQRLTSTDLLDSIRLDDRGEVEFQLQPGKLDEVIHAATSAPDRRLRCEAIVALNIVRWLGTPEESRRALEALDELSGSADPIIADSARWSRDHPTDTDQLKQWAVPANQ